MFLDRVWFWLLTIGIVYGLGKAVLAPTPEEPPPVAEEAANAEQAESDQAESDQAESDQVESPTDVETETEAESEAASKWAITRKGQEITDAAIDAAQLSVEICLQLIGVMALWLGMLEIAKRAGMVDALAYALRPVMRWLFPDVPNGHPAQGAMLMNISANMLGLDNAATPFGLGAMRELDKLNPQPGTATNAMAMFLAINTSSVTILPISIIALRAASGSESPASPIAGMFLATCVSTAVAVVAVRSLQNLRRYAAQPTEGQAATPAGAGEGGAP